MLFNSLIFILVFLPVVLGVFYWLGARFPKRVPMLWLTLASLFYYGWWDLNYVPLIVGSCVFNYFLGRKIGRSLKSKRQWLALGIAVNLLLLGYFKYAIFSIEIFNTMFSTDYSIAKIILPLAISFFTFQQITYLVDVHRGKAKDYDFQDYMLFVCFFPQLIAGPIVHHGEMMPQFGRDNTYRFDHKRLAVGLSIFAIGLAKKVLVADSLSKYSTLAFAAVGEGEGLYVIEAWVGALAYTFQLYFDFSGYSDMAIGIAWMFGIRLPENFFSPYQSTNLVEFWRRWHITLSRFLRDYLYIPLGGNKKGEIRRNINLLLTMVIGGIWHGAGWTFVVWGGVHGLWLAATHHFGKYFEAVRRCNLKVVGGLLTFWFVVSAWVLFRSPDIATAVNYLQNMYAQPEWLAVGHPGIFKDRLIGVMVALILVCYYLPNTQQLFGDHHPSIPSAQLCPEERTAKVNLVWRPTIKWAGLVMILLLTCILSLQKRSEFLYYQF